MSTRRARIKAVAVLPPRRKNQENADTKNKPKDVIEKTVNSPRTPRDQPSKIEEKNSPTINTIRSPPALLLLPISSLNKVPNSDKTPSPRDVSSPKISENTVSIIRPDKVSVIASAPGFKNVFASPLIRNSPDRRRTASPLILTSPKPTSSSETSRKLSSQITKVPDSSDKNGASNASETHEKVTNTTSRITQKDIPEDYSVPSVPESITDETVMDGIVPLQTAKNVPKPIDLLKNELISDSAEVSFDPIVPLPSPSKVRPKLRPVPRLAPHRRNSIQGSASESEDESRRALLSSGAPPLPPRQRHDSHTSHSTQQSAPCREVNRIRNDSISSIASQVATQPPPATSPVKEKHFSNKLRRQEMSRRSWCRRREVKRDALTMYDLIFYNPTTNPIVPDEDEVIAKEANAKEEAERAKAQESEEDADDPAAAAPPVPQIKLGPNGEIILDEQSLVIKQSDANRKVSSVVREGSWAGSGGGRYTRAARTADWSAAETVRFYRALAAVGTDFTLMAPLFPGRKRKDLYLKFKKEERHNGAQVDKALRAATAWDPAALQEEFTRERDCDQRRFAEAKQRLLQKKEEERSRLRVAKELRITNSRGAKAVENSVDYGASHNELTADDFVQRTLEARKAETQARKAVTKRKTKEPKFILPTHVPTPMPITSSHQTQGFATLTLLANNTPTQQTKSTNDLATISRIENTSAPQQISLNEVSGVPSNIETGSLVVLRVSDPKSPSKTMLQTYIAHGAGKLTPVSLPPTFLNSVVGYMKKGTPKSTISTASSPQLTSPSSVASQDSRSNTPSGIQANPSPTKRKRHSSYSITPL